MPARVIQKTQAAAAADAARGRMAAAFAAAWHDWLPLRRGQASTPSSAAVCGDTPFRIVKDSNRNPVCSSDTISVVS
jgi:hypothetical protein